MKNWNEVKDGDKVKCDIDGSVLEVKVWYGKKYLCGEKDMWEVNEFDYRDWEVEK